MEAFKQRLIAEKFEIEDRHNKLKTFINSKGFEEKVGSNQAVLMKQQLNAMWAYRCCLVDRIELLGIN
jgi:hypothetical protein